MSKNALPKNVITLVCMVIVNIWEVVTPSL